MRRRRKKWKLKFSKQKWRETKHIARRDGCDWVLIILWCALLELASVWIVSFDGGAYVTLLVGDVLSSREAMGLPGARGACKCQGRRCADGGPRQCHCGVRRESGHCGAPCRVALLCAVCEGPKSNGHSRSWRSVSWVVQFDRSRQSGSEDASGPGVATHCHPNVQPQRLLLCGGQRCRCFSRA